MPFVAVGLHPETRQKIVALQRAARGIGARLILTSGFRDLKKQAELMRTGRAITPARPGASTHNYGLAFDAVVEPRSLQEAVGALAPSVGLEWGGRFHRPDPVHFQIVYSRDWQRWVAENRL